MHPRPARADEPLGGLASDLLGARSVLLAGLGVFGAVSLACGLATDTAVLVAAQAVRGVGAAWTVPAAVTILATTFVDDQARTKAFGIVSLAACARACETRGGHGPVDHEVAYAS